MRACVDSRVSKRNHRRHAVPWLSTGPLAVLFIALAAFASTQAWGQTLGPADTLAATCAMCHSEGGVEDLSGFSRGEFIEEMHELPGEPSEYRLMSIIARGYSDDEIRMLAEHFTKNVGGAEREGERHGRADEDEMEDR